MAKTKKELDKDLMFKKIMPALSENPFSSLYGTVPEAQDAPQEASAPPSAENSPLAASAAAARLENAAAADGAQTLATPQPLAPAQQSVPEPELLALAEAEGEDDLSALHNRLFARMGGFDPEENVATINVMETLVARRVDEVIQRFNCCSCDRCRCDITAYALNALPPRYAVATLSNLQQCEREVSEKQVTSALVHAVLRVRTHPRH